MFVWTLTGVRKYRLNWISSVSSLRSKYTTKTSGTLKYECLSSIAGFSSRISLKWFKQKPGGSHWPSCLVALMRMRPVNFKPMARLCACRRYDVTVSCCMAWILCVVTNIYHVLMYVFISFSSTQNLVCSLLQKRVALCYLTTADLIIHQTIYGEAKVFEKRGKSAHSLLPL